MTTPNIHHFALRVRDRYEAAKFYINFLDYTIEEEFTLFFDDEQKQTAKCLSLKPSYNKYAHNTNPPPMIFISDGSPGSVVGDWVSKHGNAVHHIAIVCNDVLATMKKWKSRGNKFTSEAPFETDGLIQAFTEPDEHTGLIYELINNDVKGFRAENVKRLMESTKNIGRGAP